MNTDTFSADYQDPNCYSYIDQGNDDQCAWEFLRRNEDYAADYQHHFDDQAIYENEAQHHSHLVKSDSPFKEGAYYIPEPESGESLQQWMFRMEENGIEYHILSPARYFGHKWGLDQAIQSPLVQSIPKFRRYRYPRTLHWTELPHLFSSEEYGFSQCTDVLVVGLDLRSDFKNQENTLAKLFKAEKSKRSKDAENYKSPTTKESYGFSIYASSTRNGKV